MFLRPHPYIMAFIHGHWEERAEKWLQKWPKDFVYKPHGALQAEVHMSQADTKSSVWGRGAGKTAALVGEVVMNIDKASKTKFIAPDGRDMTSTLTPGVHIWICGPTNALLRQVIEYLELYIPNHMFLREHEPADWERTSRDVRGVTGEDRRMTIRLRVRDKNMRIARDVVRPDVKIEMKSAESKAGMQSARVDSLNHTEAQDIPERAYLDSLPTLAGGGRLGRLFVEGISPSSSQHWSAKLFNECVKDQTGRSDAFKLTSFDNPLLAERELQRILDARGRMTRMEWRRMYYADLPGREGAFFANITGCTNNQELTAPAMGHRYVAGVDLGRLVDDTVLVVMDQETRQCVAALNFENGEPYTYQLDTIEEWNSKWQFQIINVDRTGQGGDALFEQMQMRGLPVSGIVMSAREKSDLYNRLAVALEQGTLEYPEHWTDLIEQLGGVKIKGTGFGVRHFVSEGNMHDDWVDALALALSACAEPNLNVTSALGDHSVVPPTVIGTKKKRDAKRVVRVSDPVEEELRRFEEHLTSMYI